jgi:hypothetical protein
LLSQAQALAGPLPNLICKNSSQNQGGPMGLSVAWQDQYGTQAQTTILKSPLSCPSYSSDYRQELFQSTRISATFVTALVEDPLQVLPTAFVSIKEVHLTSATEPAQYSAVLELFPGTDQSKTFTFKCFSADQVPPQYRRLQCDPSHHSTVSTNNESLGWHCPMEVSHEIRYSFLTHCAS